LSVGGVGCAGNAGIWRKWPEMGEAWRPVGGHDRSQFATGPRQGREAERVVAKSAKSIQMEQIPGAIVVVRGQRVLLDAELAALYGVTTKALNQAVKRNIERFPEDFVFRLTRAEAQIMNRSQSVTGSQKHRDTRLPPHVFTEHGAVMAASILSSARAIEMSVYVVRAFVRLRAMLASNRELARRFAELEQRLDKKLADHDEAISAILEAIRELMTPAAPRKRGIGFTADLGVGGTRGRAR